MNNIIWSLTLTIGVYLLFYFIQQKYKLGFLNPLLFSSIFIIIFLIVTNIEYDTYKEGTRFISFLIAPATVSLAVPLYKNLHLVKKYYKVIISSILSGIIAHAIVLTLLFMLFSSSHEMVATFIPKSLTTAIAIDVSKSLGGIENLTVAVVIVTGILGAAIAPIMAKLLKIENNIAIGLALGTSAHALGTAKAMDFGEDAVSMSSLSLILTGIVTALIAPLIFNLITLIV
ncbi:LrgB family protein [Haploplasma modicum]|uniref:LrgB family protein n=1 Tax=Haploplasma modicum TaxID=2150 RepID=UPI0004794797|nr:LrgB family protein [Haploplasma modicum]